MSTIANPTAATGHAGAHTTTSAGGSARISPALLGMALFIASEAALFASFFAAYFYLRGTSTNWNPREFEIPIGLTFVNTMILVSSSFTVMAAEGHLKKNQRRIFLAYMLLSVALGLTFLGGQLYEYNNFVHEGFRPGQGALPSTFFALTGLHGSHVLIGATLLTIATIRGFRGHYSHTNHVSLGAFSLYWHFVDVVWLFLFAVLYLWQP